MFRNSHLHFIGIGGSGISALAQWALASGITISGSDKTESPFAKNLREKGATVFIGHDDRHLAPTVDGVIYSEAIDKNTNPEYQAALKKGLPVFSYFQALGELSKTKKTIVVVGTHGKTTTTAMLGLAAIEGGLDPTVIVGTQVPAFDNQNLRLGKSEWLIAEGCEYRRSFLNFHPFGVVFLNCEPDHLDYYKDEKDYRNAFAELIAKVPPQGFLVANGTDATVPLLAKKCAGRVTLVQSEDVKTLNVKLKVPGGFNRLNATHTYKAAEIMGADIYKVRTVLENFSGTARRMEIKGEPNGILIMDDYGHHPTEVRLTLGAIKEQYPKRRLICVFQPHQYSRTYQLLDQFKEAFEAADMVIVPDIYEARDSEEDKAKISAKNFVEHLFKKYPRARWGQSLDKTLVWLTKEARPGDLIVTMGAGNVGTLGDRLIKNLTK